MQSSVSDFHWAFGIPLGSLENHEERDSEWEAPNLSLPLKHTAVLPLHCRAAGVTRKLASVGRAQGRDQTAKRADTFMNSYQ